MKVESEKREGTGLSFVVPIYNEEDILETEISAFISRLKQKKISNYEIILAENGSTDSTLAISKRLATKFPNIQLLHLPVPHFGLAFRAGAQKAKLPFVFLLNADWLDDDFISSCLKPLERYPFIVGSKVAKGAHDERPFIRKFGSMLLTTVLRLFFGYRGSDSHGLKAFDRKTLWQLLDQCQCDEIIESELLLRARRAKINIKEIPVSVREIRAPRLSVFYRCFKVGRELIQLYSIMHAKPKTKNIHADDFGINPKVNKKITSLIQSGQLKSTSLIVNTPYLDDASRLAKKIDTMPPVFLHLNLVEGKPCAPIKKISSLVNENGEFCAKEELIKRIIKKKIDSRHVEIEVEAQITQALKAGFKLAGIDSHQHIHALSPVAEATIKSTQKHNLELIRSYNKMKTASVKGWLKLFIFRTIARISHLRYQHRISLPPTWKSQLWSDFYVASWEKVKVDKVADQSIVCHPGSPYDQLPII